MQTDAYTALARERLDALDAAIAGLADVIDPSVRSEVTALATMRGKAEWFRGWLLPPE